MWHFLVISNLKKLVKHDAVGGVHNSTCVHKVLPHQKKTESHGKLHIPSTLLILDAEFPVLLPLQKEHVCVDCKRLLIQMESCNVCNAKRLPLSVGKVDNGEYSLYSRGACVQHHSPARRLVENGNEISLYLGYWSYNQANLWKIDILVQNRIKSMVSWESIAFLENTKKSLKFNEM